MAWPLVLAAGLWEQARTCNWLAPVLSVTFGLLRALTSPPSPSLLSLHVRLLRALSPLSLLVTECSVAAGALE